MNQWRRFRRLRYRGRHFDGCEEIKIEGSEAATTARSRTGSPENRGQLERRDAEVDFQETACRRLAQRAMKPRHVAELALVVIGLVIFVGIQSERTRLNKVRYSETRAQIAELQEALERYHADNGYYPTTEQGLSALGEYYSDGRWQDEAPEIDPGMVLPRRPYKGPHPTDAWGNPYFYDSDGNMYELRSFGPNGFPQDSEDKALVARSPG